MTTPAEYRCFGCNRIFQAGDENLDLAGGPYDPRVEIRNGEAAAMLVGPRHLVSGQLGPEAISGRWCGPVEKQGETP